MGIYNIGIILCELRKKKHFSQKQLAEGICSIEYISKIENGKKTPSFDIISKLFHRLGENPSLFFTNLSSIDNELYTEHRFELEKLIGASQYDKARSFIALLVKKYPFYSSGEPHQYIMGKESFILQNLDKKFDEAYDMALRSILLTKPDFTIDTMDNYEFYSINELWSLLYMASALYWKVIDLNLGNDIETSILLASFVLSHLDRAYLHPSMMGTLYASATFYLGKYYRTAMRIEEASAVCAKGFQFVTEYYNQLLELLGKIIINQAWCLSLDKPWKNMARNDRFLLSDILDTKMLYELIGQVLLLISANDETMQQYFDFPYQEIIKKLSLIPSSP